VSNHVVARSDGGGDLGIRHTAIHQVLLYPISITLPSILLNLEPLGLSRVELVAGLISARRYVCQYGASIMRPLATICSTPVESELAPRVGVQHQRGRFCSRSAIDIRVGGTLDGILGENLADATGLGATANAVALDEFAVDGHVLNKTMRSDKG